MPLIAGIVFLVSRAAYNLSLPQEYISKGTNADYSARGIPMP